MKNALYKRPGHEFDSRRQSRVTGIGGAALLAITGLMLASPSLASEFNVVQADRSTLNFAAKQMGVPVDGKFRKFTAQIAFDPARPQAAKAAIEIDLASVDAGSDEANDEVVGKLWFNVKVYPTARFVSTAVKPLGGNRFELTGKLSIKGRTQDTTTEVSVTQQGNLATFDGGFVIKRADFAIGEGSWSDFDTVANEIPIHFHIVAASAAAKK
jgi:polyisoprenoid-binding protein YceI